MDGNQKWWKFRIPTPMKVDGFYDIKCYFAARFFDSNFDDGFSKDYNKMKWFGEGLFSFLPLSPWLLFKC